jgi:hypothetical protein
VNLSKRQPHQPIPAGEVVAKFVEYQDAVAFVEKLIDKDFPPTAIAIVGDGLRTVERVRARLNYAGVAINGGVRGSWFGLIAAIIFTDLTDARTFAFWVFIGAGVGMLFNIARFALMRNKRGFMSGSMVVAKEYAVQVPADLVAQANQISGL